ncbi:MAG: hypothetical protein Q4G40_11380, partial [Brachybacterium sp.]|nr:hypothetical protein [Brachybacterium sp.]
MTGPETSENTPSTDARSASAAGDSTPSGSVRHASAPVVSGRAGSIAELFPPFGLVVTAGPLVMRMLRDEDFPAYGALLRERIFDEGEADH